ncbi:MAG: hypothetical protein E3J29_07365, partial [Dehalococcoidia bacterium]
MKPLNETVSKSADILQFWGRSVLQGSEAAGEWMRKAAGMPTLSEQAAESLARHSQELADFLDTAEAGIGSYTEYVTIVGEVNSELAEWEAATVLITQAQFDFNQTMTDSTATVTEQLDALRALTEERTKAGGVVGMWAQFQHTAITAQILEADAIEQTTAALEAQRIEIEKINKARAETGAAIVEAREAMEDLGADIADLTAKQSEQLEKQAEAHQKRMAEIARRGAARRVQLATQLARSLADAERDRTRALEDAARQHGQAVQDIERRHQERLRDIEASYQKTVAEASIERDALAILRARERRTEELDEANRDRTTSLDDENRNFAEQQRQAQQAYQDRVEAARRSYTERLRELEQELAAEAARERAAWAERKAAIEKENQIELGLQETQYAELEAAYQRHLWRMHRIRKRMRAVSSPVGGAGGTTGMQAGFEGIVTGPRTFKVEPGVTEFVYASGALGQRQTVMPSAAATQAAGLRAAVSGQVGVGLSGFSEGLLARVGP